MTNIAENPSAVQELWPGLKKVVTEERYVSIVPLDPNLKSHNDLRRTFRSYTDPQRKYTYGIPIKFDKNTGLYVFNRIVIDGSQIYNLRNLNEAREFAIVANSPLVKGSPNTTFHIPAVFRLLDQEKEATNSVNLFDKIMNYGIKIRKMAKQDLSDLALVILGSTALNNSLDMNLNLIFTELQKNPAKVIGAVDNSSRSEVQAIFARGVATRMIVFNKDTGYITEHGSFLGYDMYAAMTRLSQQPELLRTVDYESKNRQGNKASTGHAPTPDVTEEMNIEEAIRRSQTEDAATDLIGLLHSEQPENAKGIDYINSTNYLDNDNVPVPEIANNPEFDSLMEDTRENSAPVNQDLVSSILEESILTTKAPSTSKKKSGK